LQDASFPVTYSKREAINFHGSRYLRGGWFHLCDPPQSDWVLDARVESPGERGDSNRVDRIPQELLLYARWTPRRGGCRHRQRQPATSAKTTSKFTRLIPWPTPRRSRSICSFAKNAACGSWDGMSTSGRCGRRRLCLIGFGARVVPSLALS